MSDSFSFDAFKQQLRLFMQPDYLEQMLVKASSGFQAYQGFDQTLLVRFARRQLGIIDAMTPGERRAPQRIGMSRRRRIAVGAGVDVQEVKSLIAMVETTRSMIDGPAAELVCQSLSPRVDDWPPEGGFGRWRTR